MIYTLSNRPIEGFPEVRYFNNLVWGGNKPKGIKEINMPTFLNWVSHWHRNDDNSPTCPICFETELIDSTNEDDDNARLRLDQVLRHTLMQDFPNLKIGVFDQSGKIGFKKFHLESKKFDQARADFNAIIEIGNTYFGPFYVNDKRLAKIERKGIAWFGKVVRGRRVVVESSDYDQYVMSINHTTIGKLEGSAELTIEMQREAYVGDEVWEVLCRGGGGDVLVWTHYQQRAMLPEAEAIMRRVQEEMA